MSHARHRAPRPHRQLPMSMAAGVAAPLAVAALGLVGAPAAQAMAPAGPSAAPVAVPAAGGSYTVKAGDTLASIARTLGVPGGWQAIASANRSTVPNPGVIRVGQRLVIPGGTGGSTTPPASGSGSSGSGSSGSGSGSGSSGSGSAGSTTSSGSAMVDQARTFLGVPYRWGGTSRSGVDCSGLTSLVLRHAGYSPPRTAAAQYGWVQKISSSQARPGDLVFSYFSGGRPGHVGIYIGGGKMIDAPRPGKVVGVHNLHGDPRFGRPPGR